MSELGSQTTEYPDWVIQIQNKRRNKVPVVKNITKEEEKPVPEKNQKRRIYHRLPETVDLQRPDFANVYKACRVELGPLSETREIGQDPVKNDTLDHFLKIHNVKIESCYDALREEVDNLQDAYDGLGKKWLDNPDTFLRMMLLDGCFLYEFVRTNRDYRYLFPFARVREDNPTIKKIAENGEEMKHYVHDILLLENQLPMLLLTLLDFADQRDKSITESEAQKGFRLLIRDIQNIPLKRRMLISTDEMKSSLHLLDVYRKNLLHHKFNRGETLERRSETKKFCNIYMIPSTTKLHTAGIGFTISNSTSLLDIRLRRKTLMLPEIVINDSTKSTFLNLIAFEQLHKNEVEMEFTTYMYFMGWLVQNADDANLLQSRRIIKSVLRDAEVAELFQTMSKGISRDSDNDMLAPAYVDMMTMVRERYNSILLRKDRVRTYLETPWKVATTIAAIVLFTLTTIQTVFSVLAYFNGGK